jgi:hypothetical protein
LLCEVKIDGLALDLVYRDRTARSGRHPGRRPVRRRRHRQRAHDRRHPADAARPRPRPARGARGGVHAAVGVRRAERVARGRGQGAVRQPAQLRGGSLRQKDPRVTASSRRLRFYCHGIGASSGAPVATAVTGLRCAGRLGAADQPPQRGGARACPRRWPTSRAMGGASPRPGARDGRRGAQGRRSGPAGRAGVHLAGPAVGDRVQVPARGGQHEAAEHRGQHRPHRPRHPVRRDGAGRGGRLDRRDGDAAQRPRGGPQRRPPRRHRGAAQGGRRDPRDPGAGAGAAPRGPACVGRCRRTAPAAAPSWSRSARATRTCAAPTRARAPASCANGCSTSRRGPRSTSRCWASRRRTPCCRPAHRPTRATCSPWDRRGSSRRPTSSPGSIPRPRSAS